MRTGTRCTRRRAGSVSTPARTIAGWRCAACALWACGWRSRWTSGIEVAHWLSKRPEVKQVLHPALPGAPGHAIWKRDFTGACSLFGVEFKPRYSRGEHACASSKRWTLFGIGASWGGFESLALPTTGFITRTAGSGQVRRTAGAAAYRAGGRGRPDRRSGAGAEGDAGVRAVAPVRLGCLDNDTWGSPSLGYQPDNESHLGQATHQFGRIQPMVSPPAPARPWRWRPRGEAAICH